MESMPYMSSPGKAMPQSTTMISPPNSKTVMFLPISLSPPKGMIFNFSAMNEIPSFQKSMEASHSRPGHTRQKGRRKPRRPSPAQPRFAVRRSGHARKSLWEPLSLFHRSGTRRSKTQRKLSGGAPSPGAAGALVHAPPPRPPAAGSYGGDHTLVLFIITQKRRFVYRNFHLFAPGGQAWRPRPGEPGTRRAVFPPAFHAGAGSFFAFSIASFS